MKWSLHPYRLPLARPYVWAKGRQTAREGILVRAEDEGQVGWGEIAPPIHLGLPEHVLAEAQTVAQEGRVAGASARVRCGFDEARLEVEAKRMGRPLHKHLAERLGGPAARGVACNALLDGDAGPAEANAAVRAGYTTLKVKLGPRAMEETRRLTAIREAVGPRIVLRADANESWTAGALQTCTPALAAIRLDYLEQPVPAHDARQREAALACGIPLALDEGMDSVAAIEAVARLSPRPVVIAKPQRIGGPTDVLAFLAAAQRARLRVVMTNSLETAVGRAHTAALAALLPESAGACGLATGHYLARDVAHWPDAPHLAMSQEPGLGLEVHP